jgi:two-component system, LytTR family, sensor kinase
MRFQMWLVKHRRGIGLYLGFWLVLGLFSSFEVYIAQQLWDKPIALTLAFRRSYEEALSYAVCVAGALWFCSRPNLQSMRRRTWILTHTGAALVFSFAHVVVLAWIEAGERSVQTGDVLTFRYLFKRFLMYYTLSDFLKYWIVILGHLGWRYYLAYRERERQAASLTTELVQARLQALRMQINPHFLFNTFNTISALIRENPEAADRVVVRLGELLRRTLDRGEVQEVPLREEIAFLRGYLEIELMRFGDRLTVDFDMDPNSTELLVPHLILQPLVENALRHGILPREEAGRVEIGSRLLEDGRLELRVLDDGNGLPAAVDGAAREGIGLRNVQSRLAQLYGDAHEFRIYNAPGAGVEVRLIIPSRVGADFRGPGEVPVVAPTASYGEPAPVSALPATNATAR